jgi:hypothetical protein
MRKLAAARTHEGLTIRGARILSNCSYKLKSSYELRSLYPDKPPSANNKTQETCDREANANLARSTDYHPPPSQGSKQTSGLQVHLQARETASFARMEMREEVATREYLERRRREEAGRGGAGQRKGFRTRVGFL